MASRYLVAVFVCFQVAHSQYSKVPPASFPQPSYSYYYPPSKPAVPANVPASPNIQSRSPDRGSKRSVFTPPGVKCFPQTASAYFLTTPSEKVKATVLPKEKVKTVVLPKEKLTETPIVAPTYSCPLCNNFADIPPNSKIPPPPPIGSPVLPGVADLSTIDIIKDLTAKIDDAQWVQTAICVT